MIRCCTLIEWPNSLKIVPSEVTNCHNLPFGEGLCILKMRVRKLFTHSEGISTPHARHKGQQPLIECANHEFKIIYFSLLCLLSFPFYVFILFGVDKGVALAPMYPRVRLGNQTYIVL